MKSNKKGFTLIELLAVIVILAIIALIATPIILQIITKARRSASVDSLYGVMAAAKSTYMETLLDADQIVLPMTVNCDGTKCEYTDNNSPAKTDTVKFSGSIPTGTFTVDVEGKITPTAEGAITVNGFKCTIKANDTVECS